MILEGPGGRRGTPKLALLAQKGRKKWLMARGLCWEGVRNGLRAYHIPALGT